MIDLVTLSVIVTYTIDQLAQKGRYGDALIVMDEVGQDMLRTLKNQQYWIAFSGLLRLQNRLHRYVCQS